jgi:hypothetical protein
MTQDCKKLGKLLKERKEEYSFSMWQMFDFGYYSSLLSWKLSEALSGL